MAATVVMNLALVQMVFIGAVAVAVVKIYQPVRMGGSVSFLIILVESVELLDQLMVLVLAAAPAPVLVLSLILVPSVTAKTGIMLLIIQEEVVRRMEAEALEVMG